MARFSVGGDEDGNEEGTSNDRPLPKKPRSSEPIVCALKSANTLAAVVASTSTPTPTSTSTSTSNSGNPTTASNSQNPATNFSAPLLPVERNSPPEESVAAEMESNDESEMDSDTSLSDSDDEDLTSSSEEEGEQQEQPSRNEEQPSEAQVNSTPVEPTGDTPTPVSITLTDPDVLDCPICLEPLSPPIYQCENGHIACASCCIKMRNKCASCCWPIGYNRCRAIEKVLEAVKISCRNMQHGCRETIVYSKKQDHEMACIYAPCSCPYHGCNHVCTSTILYLHFATEHSSSCKKFVFNSVIRISLDVNQKHLFLQERNESIIFILDRTIDHFGSLISVICIAPFSSNRMFLYELATKEGDSSIRVSTIAENMPKWIAQPHSRKFFRVPSGFISSCGPLKVELTIKSLK